MTADYLTVRQLATRLGIGVKWIYDRTADDSIPCRRFGAAIRFAPSDVAAIEDMVRNPAAATSGRTA